MRTSRFLKCLELMEEASRWIVPEDLDLAGWCGALRAMVAGEEATEAQSQACEAVQAAMATVSQDGHRLNDGERDLVAACVNALRELPLDELRVLAGTCVPDIPPESPDHYHEMVSWRP